MEKRRLQAAWELLAGARQAELARKYGVSRTTAHRWCRTVQEEGFQSLLSTSATGRPSYLTRAQWNRLVELYAAGPLAYAFDSDEWTASRLGAMIEAEFGAEYQRDYVRRLRRKLDAIVAKRASQEARAAVA